MCPHIASMWRIVDSAKDWDTFVPVIRSLLVCCATALGAEPCATAVGVFGEASQWFTNRVQLEMDNPDSKIPWETAVGQRARPPGAKQRARADEHFLEDLVTKKVRRGEAASAAHGSRGAEVNFSESGARAAELKEICLFHCAQVRTCQELGQVHMCEDGSRLGWPSEETIIYLGWNALTDFGILPSPQVLPDFHCMKMYHDRSLTSESLTALAERVSMMFLPDQLFQAELAKLTGKTLASMKERFQANKDSLAANDNALQVSVHPDGLAYFSVRGSTTNYQPLDITQWERKLEPLGDSPPEVQLHSPGRQYRSCLFNMHSEAKEYEVQWLPHRPSYFAHTDRGSIGWPGKNKFFSSGRVRGDVIPDLAHRRNDGHHNAIHDVGAGPVKLEIGLWLVLLRRPFKGCGNFRTLLHAHDQFFKSRNAVWVIFIHCYPMIVRQRWRGQPVAGYLCFKILWFLY